MSMFTCIGTIVKNLSLVLYGTTPPTPESMAIRSLHGGFGALATYDPEWLGDDAVPGQTALENHTPHGLPK